MPKKFYCYFYLILLIAGQISGSAQTQDNRGLERIAALPKPANRYALIIGVDKYEDAKIATLGGATNDARTLADALKHYAGFPDDQVVLLSTDGPPERQPKRNTILE